MFVNTESGREKNTVCKGSGKTLQIYFLEIPNSVFDRIPHHLQDCLSPHKEFWNDSTTIFALSDTKHTSHFCAKSVAFSRNSGIFRIFFMFRDGIGGLQTFVAASRCQK